MSADGDFIISIALNVNCAKVTVWSISALMPVSGVNISSLSIGNLARGVLLQADRSLTGQDG